MRFRVGLAFLLVLVAAGFTAATASANHTWSLNVPTDPQYHDLQATNIPYLAWRGDELRIVKCDPRIGTVPASAAGFSADVVDWSGPFFQQPQVASFQFFTGAAGSDQAGMSCFAILF